MSGAEYCGASVVDVAPLAGVETGPVLRLAGMGCVDKGRFPAHRLQRLGLIGGDLHTGRGSLASLALRLRGLGSLQGFSEVIWELCGGGAEVGVLQSLGGDGDGGDFAVTGHDQDLRFGGDRVSPVA